MKKFSCLIIAIFIIFILSSCHNITSTPNEIDTMNTMALPSAVADEDSTTPIDISYDTTQIVSESDIMNPYLSIVGRREKLDSENPYWDEVYFIYDLVTNELNEVCVVPHNSGYTTGVVSLWDNALYFSRREEERANDRICKYDIESGEMDFIENENWSYNDFTLLDPATLLVIASTPAHTITPARFGLDSRTFTYMADVNEEDFDLYTTNGMLMNYNYMYDKFPWAYFDLGEYYLDSFRNQDESIERHMTILSSNMKKNNPIFTEEFLIPNEVKNMTIVSENVALVRVVETGFDESTLIYNDDGTILSGGWIYTEIYYYLTIEEDNAFLVEIESPFPEVNVYQCFTFDEGETYYCRGDYNITATSSDSGLFIYDCKTNEITPILLEGDGILSVANFRAIG